MATKPAQVFADAHHNGRGARITTERRLELALVYLRERIAHGTDYPDAEWQAGVRFGVDCDAIRAAYDNQEGAR